MLKIGGTRMKKLYALALVLILGISLVGCGNGGSETTADTTPAATSAETTAPEAETDAPASTALITVGFSQVGAESDWRTANTESMKTTFTNENGYELIFDDAQQKQDNQITAIRNFIQQEVDYIVLAPIAETGWDTVLQEAKDAGIPVIIVDRMIDVSDDSLFTSWVGSDFRAEGDKAVAWMEEKFADADTVNIVHLQGTIGSSAQIGRTEALEAGVEANESWDLVAQQTGEFTQAKGQEVMESILKQNSDIDVVYAENDNMAFGAIDAIEAAGKTVGVDGDITVISFDATHAGLEMVLEGKINFNVECNPLHGPRVAELIEMLESGGTPEKLNYVEEAAFDAATFTQADLDARAY